ncbi:hypothetical protein CSKR_100920 [Clonorchis sinensis]|uniref:Uncharacterized protein n=1 Tax=Clonorchis sinensis TaxID=79923 RepID=A0A3R7D557_CLOSI|nr:hypothetical protein CSKR_100920 [Clonorchis sinensis]
MYHNIHKVAESSSAGYNRYSPLLELIKRQSHHVSVNLMFNVNPNWTDCDEYSHFQTTVINEIQLDIVESPVKSIIRVRMECVYRFVTVVEAHEGTPGPASQYANNQLPTIKGPVIAVESVRMPTTSAREKQLDRVYVDLQTYTVLAVKRPGHFKSDHCALDISISTPVVRIGFRQQISYHFTQKCVQVDGISRILTLDLRKHAIAVIFELFIVDKSALTIAKKQLISTWTLETRSHWYFEKCLLSFAHPIPTFICVTITLLSAVFDRFKPVPECFPTLRVYNDHPHEHTSEYETYIYSFLKTTKGIRTEMFNPAFVVMDEYWFSFVSRGKCGASQALIHQQMQRIEQSYQCCAAISLYLNGRVHQATVRAELMYGCETWLLRTDDVRRLQVLDHRCVRIVDGGEWCQRISNKEMAADRCQWCSLSD